MSLVLDILAVFLGSTAAPAEPTEPLGVHPAPTPTEATPQDTPEPTRDRLIVVGAEGAPWRAAIEAHLAGLSIEVIDAPVRSHSSIEDRYARGASLTDELDALGMLWIETTPTAYELYLVRAGLRVVYRRSVSTDGETPQTALEALGVVTGSTADALLAGRAVTMEPMVIAEPEPEPEPAPEPAPAPEPEPEPPRAERGRALLAVGYAGTTYTREKPWQSGVAFEAGWVWPFGLSVAAGYGVLAPLSAQRGPASIRVTRHPVHLAAGYAHHWRNLWFSGEGLLIVDPTSRRAALDDASTGLSTAPPGVRTTVGLGPRARVGVALVWRLELSVAAAAEFWLGQVKYAVQLEPGQTAILQTPRRVRFSPTIGLAVRP